MAVDLTLKGKAVIHEAGSKHFATKTHMAMQFTALILPRAPLAAIGGALLCAQNATITIVLAATVLVVGLR